MDEKYLIEALRRGDEHAFNELILQYHSALIRLAMAYVHDLSVAEEVAQDAWLGFLEGLPRFAERSSLKTWLFGILTNCAMATNRREERMVAFSTLGADWADGAPSVDSERFLPADSEWAGHRSVPPEEWPEERLLDAETEVQVEEAITHLSTTQRVVLVLRDVEGWSSSEVCNALDISDGNQRVLLHRARSHVRQELETYIGLASEDGP